MTPDDRADLIAETRAEQRDLGDPMLPADWERMENGPWWNEVPSS